MLELEAHAKINLGLDVIRKREDGYHLVKMIMQSIRLHDVISLEKNHSGEIRLTLEGSALPADERNLAYKAAALMKKAYSIPDGISIHLKKQIPEAAGMAGGSTDAATVLIGMDRLFGLGLSKDVLLSHGLELGADVPFCILGGTCLSEGIGEILTPLPAMPSCYIVLVKPSQGVSTKEVYQALDKVPSPVHPPIDAQLEDLKNGDLTSLCAHMGNILESVTLPLLPALNGRKSHLEALGADGMLMSGSGPTIFGIFVQKDPAVHACQALKEVYPEDFIMVTEPCQPSNLVLQ